MHITIRLRGDRVSIASSAMSTVGVMLPREPFTTFSVGEKATLAVAFRDRLSRERGIAPGPSAAELDASLGLFVRVFGSRFWSLFGRNTQYWTLWSVDGGYELMRWRHAYSDWIRSAPASVTILPLDMPVDEMCAHVATILRHAVGTKLPHNRRNPAPEIAPVLLPDGDRIDELGDFLEWIANARPEDEADIRGEIKRYYYDHGDDVAGDALNQALDRALTPGVTWAQRRDILTSCEQYTRYDPRDRDKP